MDGTHTTHIHEEYVPKPDQNQARSKFFGEAAVDIIAVQGLGSSYQWTWSVDVPGQNTSRYHWLRQSLPRDCPDARVTAFDYDTTWYGDTIKTTLEECGAQLLRSIIQDRSHRQSPHMCPSRIKRPIIFVGHSFGGLVIKQSLILADQTSPTDPLYQAHQNFLSAVTHIFFLGTPHYGSTFLRLANVKILLGKLTRTRVNDDLLRVLNLKSELLNYLQNEFDRLRKKPVLSGLQLVCFFEKKEQKIGPMSFDYVVPKDSACIGGATHCGLETYHTGMNKFYPVDKNYDIFKQSAVQASHEAPQISLQRFNSRQYSSLAASPELKTLRKWLAPATDSQKRQLEARYRDQRNTASTYATCKWFPTSDDFESWSTGTENKNMLWIHGKPGSGKSVLAAYTVKYLLQQTETTQTTSAIENCLLPTSDPNCKAQYQQSSVLYFFCGIEPIKDFTVNLIGTLVHQLLAIHSENSRMQTTALRLSSSPSSYDGPNSDDLTDLLVELCALVDKVFIIIDGLEENAHYKECIELFSRLGSSSSIRLLLLSQVTGDMNQRIVKAFPSFREFDITLYSQADIDNFITQKTISMVDQNPDLMAMKDEIVEHLKQEAEGMFQYVNKAIEHLEDELDGIKHAEQNVSPGELRKSLHSLHRGLNYTYRKVFDRISRDKDDYEQVRIRSALMWLSACGRPMRTSDLWASIQLEEDDVEFDTVLDVDAPTQDHSAEAHLKRLLGPLIEVLPDDDGQLYVQICHSSLQKYVTQLGSAEDSPPEMFRFTNSIAHDTCTKACLAVCRESSTYLYRSKRPVRQLPLVLYAWTFWAFHLKQSSTELEDDQFSALFNQMLLSVSEETLKFLLVMSQYASGPHDLPEIKERLQFVISFQRFEDALVKPMRFTAKLRQVLPLAQVLQSARSSVTTHAAHYYGSIRSSEGANIQAHSTEKDSRRGGLAPLRVDKLLKQEPWSSAPQSQHLENIASIARCLRILSLRLAVNPIYDHFMKIFDDQPSILLFLVYQAAFFESVGSYNYWEKLPDFVDPEEAFIVTDPNDQDYAAAAFVRHRLEIREGHRLLAGPAPVTDWDLLDKQSIRPQHNMSSQRWYTAVVAYQLWSRPPGLAQTFVVNPLHHAHQRHTMHMDVGSPARYLTRAQKTLDHYMPKAVTEKPATEFVRSIPALLPMFFARYIEAIVQGIFGTRGWLYLIFQNMRLKLVFQRFEILGKFYTLLRDPNEPMTVAHLLLAVGLYGIRCWYFPILGSHLFRHPLRHMYLAYNEPAQLFTEVYGYTWKAYSINILQTTIGGSLFAGAITLFRASRPTRDIAIVFALFWGATYFERGLCAAVNVLSPPFAVINALLGDEEIIRSLIKFSLLYWFRVIVNLTTTAANMGLIQQFGVGAIFVVILCPICISLCFIWYPEAIVNFLVFIVFKLTWPFRFTAFLIRHFLLRPLFITFVNLEKALIAVAIPALKTAAALIALAAIFSGISIFTKWCGDPLGLNESATELQRAVKQARLALPGSVPLRLDSGAKREKPPIQLPKRPRRTRIDQGRDRIKTE